jgi:Pyridoxamine 5'-phosphate oxidase
MADFFNKLDQKHIEFINKQPLFTVASAPSNGRINISPKGLDSFLIIDAHTVAYQDLVGSGNETAAHLKENGRITLMFMSFSRNALILRIYGKGRACGPNSDEFKKYSDKFPVRRGVRQIMFINIEQVATSCGYGVPEMELKSERDTMGKWIDARSDAALVEYKQKYNALSIDGLDCGLDE